MSCRGGAMSDDEARTPMVVAVNVVVLSAWKEEVNLTADGVPWCSGWQHYVS